MGDVQQHIVFFRRIQPVAVVDGYGTGLVLAQLFLWLKARTCGEYRMAGELANRQRYLALMERSVRINGALCIVCALVAYAMAAQVEPRMADSALWNGAGPLVNKGLATLLALYSGAVGSKMVCAAISLIHTRRRGSVA